MKPGERFRFLRELEGISQAYIAEVANVSQKTISTVENNKTFPQLFMLDVLGQYYGCSEEWLKAGKSPAYCLLGYAEVPPPHKKNYEKTMFARELRKLDKTLRTLFLDFLYENAVEEYCTVTPFDLQRPDRLYIFILKMLEIPVTYILRCRNEDIEKAIRYTVRRLGLKKIGEATMRYDDIEKINAPTSEKTMPEVIFNMYELLGIVKKDESIKEQWIADINSFKKSANTVKNEMDGDVYKKKVDEICRMIIVFDIDIQDVVKNLEENKRD